MTRVLRLCLALLASLCFATLPSVARAQDSISDAASATVTSIDVSGTVHVEPEAIRRAARLVIGQEATQRLLGDTIRAVYALGFFDDVSIDARPADSGIAVTIVVVERPTVADVLIEGEDEVDETDIREKLAVKKGSILNQQQVQAGVSAIEELYREKGFYLATVTPKVEARSTSEVVVTYNVEEAEKVRIARVDFLGNSQIPAEEIQNNIETRPGDYLSFLNGLGNFKQDALDIDVQRIRLLYYDRGYLDVSVGEPVVSLSRDRERVYISIPINEGAAYEVSSVGASGDLLDTPEKTLEGARLKPGALFSASAVRTDMQRITNIYKDRGYANANVNLLTRLDPDTHQVAVTYQLERGEICYIGRIEVAGNDITRDRVVRRELAIGEGDQYSTSDIELSKMYVRRLGFFEDVQIEEAPSTDNPRIVNLKVQVKERSTRSLQAGAGFSSGESLFFMASISENNLFGRGQSLTLNTTLSSLRKMFVLSFVEPRVADSKWTLGVDLFQRTIQYPQFTRDSRGFSVNVGVRPFEKSRTFRDLSFNVGYRLEDVSVDQVATTGIQSGFVLSLYRSGLTSSVNGSMSWDRRDDQYMPTRGFYQSIYGEVADDTLASTNEFFLTRGTSRWYARPYWGTCPTGDEGGGFGGALCRWFTGNVLKLNAEIAYAGSMADRKAVPISERFFEGGPNSVRGFQRLTLGPTRTCAGGSDPLALTGDCPIGGVESLVFNAELEFPILDAIGVRGVVFADAGNAFDAGQPYTLNLDVLDPSAQDVLRTALGFGVRWRSPIGPLRFEWGYPLARRSGEDSYVFEFSIGNSF